MQRAIDRAAEYLAHDIKRYNIRLLKESGFIFKDDVAIKVTVQPDHTVIVWRDEVRDVVKPYTPYPKCLTVLRRIIKVAKQAEFDETQSSLFD